MPPRLPRIAFGSSGLSRFPIDRRKQQICLICMIHGALPRGNLAGQLGSNHHRAGARNQSSIVSVSTTDFQADNAAVNPRRQLREALIDLQKHASTYINISRLQLAIRGLGQTPGKETIRIGVLAQSDGGVSLRRAKELLRLLLADPLSSEEEWERILTNEQPSTRPLLLKVEHDGQEEIKNRLVQEIDVSSPTLNGHKLEILVLDLDPPRLDTPNAFMESVLVPTMEIPTSSTGRYTPVTTPVHKCLIFSEGLLGAASALSYPVNLDRDLVITAVEVKIGNDSERIGLPFQVVDINLGSEALGLFRQSIENAVIYEEKWFASGVPDLLDWIKSGTAATEGEMKEPLRKLIDSLISNTSMALESDRSHQLSAALNSKVSSTELNEIRLVTSQWAERAHTELRDQLDIAFEGKRWRKLGWWKLFWRVDDVSMIGSDILSQRFLTNAEKEIIYVSGGIAQAGLSSPPSEVSSTNWAFKPEEKKVNRPTLGSLPDHVTEDLLDLPEDHGFVDVYHRPWPLQIPIARAQLSQESVPALQALAQKLVFQTLSTSSLASVLGGLMYASSISTGLYEAGAVAALGIVWSLRRMQGKWETARKFWEGEVREEGRKAVREAEAEVSGLLNVQDKPLETDPEFEKAVEALARAKNALERII